MKSLPHNLYDRIANLDEYLADEVSNVFRAIALRRAISDAEDRLSEACHLASYDMTGQDHEDQCNHAAAELVRARDDLIKETDPERWAEMKMGC